MEWRAHFTATWFDAWHQAQLAGPHEYVREYDALRSAIELPERLVPTVQASGALTLATVRDVYTFGHLIGQLSGRLLALPQDVIARRVDWCGRFNLGISLFDYIADEAGERDALGAMPVFDRLRPAPAQRAEPAAAPQSEASRALSEVAGHVLARLESDTRTAEAGAAVDPLWEALGEMMRSELIMAQGRARVDGGLDHLRNAARAKSAEPFRCMAEFLCMDATVDPALRDTARELGIAIGECFWLIDDARDLWEDFDGDRWNVFLLVAARDDPRVARHPPDLEAEMRLSRLLVQHGWAQREVVPVVQRLRTALAHAPAPPANRHQISGLLATAMQRWLTS